MKFLNYFLLIVVLGCAGMFVSCEDEGANPNDPVQKNWAYLTSATWNIEMVMLNDDDVTDAYPGLQIRFNRNGTYEVTNPIAPIWSNGGTFLLVTESELLLDDNREMTVEVVNATTLVITFPYEPANAKVTDVAGTYTFTFNK